MTKEQFQRGIGRMHKMMDKHIEKAVIEDSLKLDGFDDEQIDEMFGIVLRATVNKLLAYYDKNVVKATIDR